MTADRWISSDSHIVDPPDLWASRMEPTYSDRAAPQRKAPSAPAAPRLLDSPMPGRRLVLLG
jgi:hypothetical protein